MRNFMENVNNEEIAIEVKDVKKHFRSYKDKASSFKERFVNPSRNKYEEVQVLKGISFDVKKGEAIGIIGKNGCGKSTTLKLLTRILYPDAGEIKIKGRVSSLIELGAGFHPDMSGRENIYTNASIFGIKKKEVDRRLEDIIRFSELEEFIDHPVRTYSSGMYMRLAFAVAINVDADVLLIDEILAVGDSAFQKKCFEKLKEIKANGTTIVIVSHSMDQMYRICDRLIWIEKGMIKDEGAPRIIGEEYLAAMEGRRLDRIELEKQQRKEALEKKIAAEKERLRLEEEKKRVEKEKHDKELEELARLERENNILAYNATLKDICKFCHPNARREGDGRIHYTKVKIVDSKGNEVYKLVTGQNYSIVMDYENDKEERYAKFVIGITRNDGIYCYGTSVNKEKFTVLEKKGSVEFRFKNALLKGTYFLDLWITLPNGENCENIYGLLEFSVNTIPYKERGFLTMEHNWVIDNNRYGF